jgi:hypothetical protein
MYSGKLLMMGGGTARNMQFHDNNKFEKLVRLLVLLKINFLNIRYKILLGNQQQTYDAQTWL